MNNGFALQMKIAMADVVDYCQKENFVPLIVVGADNSNNTVRIFVKGLISDCTRDEMIIVLQGAIDILKNPV